IVNSFKEQRYPVRFLASRVLWRLNMTDYFLIDKGQFRIRFFPSALSAAYWVDPVGRKDDEVFLSAYLKKCDVFVDVGANIGVLSLVAAAAVGDTGKVISIEGHPRIFDYLCKNVAMNQYKNITLINAAVGEKKGKICFSDDRSDDLNSVVPESALEVSMVTLDELVAPEVDCINLLKVDVEGFEKFVFEGASKVLGITECVYFESCEKHFAKYGYSCADIFSLLMDHRFRLYKVNSQLISPIAFGHCSSFCENLLAVKDEEHFISRSGFRVTS
ncbi:MAG TPA: FkbM family methyltransferase, partial [Bacteroidota bacterium]|nr:FkbM family methyltransferase [Bacteroidota bacterium]